MKQKGKITGKKLKQMFVTYTFVLPDFIGLLVFIIIPIIYSFYMSLYDWNFANMTNKSRDIFAYTLVDLETKADAATIEKLKAIQGMMRVRVIK